MTEDEQNPSGDGEGKCGLMRQKSLAKFSVARSVPYADFPSTVIQSGGIPQHLIDFPRSDRLFNLVPAPDIFKTRLVPNTHVSISYRFAGWEEMASWLSLFPVHMWPRWRGPPRAILGFRVLGIEFLVNLKLFVSQYQGERP
jgi:hypothetical protein